MSGYVTTVGHCYACGRLFSFNPHRVPSVPVLGGEIVAGGRREPICRGCATLANEARKVSRLPLWDVSDAAYGPIEESSL